MKHEERRAKEARRAEGGDPCGPPASAAAELPSRLRSHPLPTIEITKCRKGRPSLCDFVFLSKYRGCSPPELDPRPARGAATLDPSGARFSLTPRLLGPKLGPRPCPPPPPPPPPPTTTHLRGRALRAERPAGGVAAPELSLGVVWNATTRKGKKRKKKRRGIATQKLWVRTGPSASARGVLRGPRLL